MLALSPPLPLVIYHLYDAITEDVDGIILALEQRDRVRRIRLLMPVSNLHMLVMVMDGEYPVLEHLIMEPAIERGSALMLPKTLQAPQLRHLLLKGFAPPIGSRFFTSTPSIVTLAFVVSRPHSYFQPNFLLQWLSFTPQLEKLLIYFPYPVPNYDLESQLVHTPIMTHVSLPNLRWFEFKGPGADLAAVIRRITTPRLERLRIQFCERPTFSLPSLLPFMNTSENLKFDSAKFKFSNTQVYVKVYLREEPKLHALSMTVFYWQPSWQVSFMAQIFNSPGQIFSKVEHLILGHESPNEPDEADRAEWRQLLGSFGNVKTLRVNYGLVKELSHCLSPDDGEHPLEVLPELQELKYSGSGDTGDTFASFIDARQNAGHPVTLIRRR
jgi:hypothetical protein